MSRFDWDALLRAGVRGLGMRPTEFWDLTPAELRLMLGQENAGGLDRAGLEALMCAYPDSLEGDRHGRE